MPVDDGLDSKQMLQIHLTVIMIVNRPAFRRQLKTGHGLRLGQVAELHVRVALLNRFAQLGRPATMYMAAMA